MTEGGLVRGCHCKAQKILKKPSQRRGQYCLHIFNFYHKLLQSWLPLEIRSILLQSFDDGDISEYEFLLLYNVNTSKTQIFFMKVMGNLTLMTWMTVSVYPSFAFVRVTFPSFLRPYIFLTTVQVNKEQYAMALKGCVSHFEGLRTRVDSVI